MGYTHSAYLESRDITDEEWSALCKEIMALNMERLEHITITNDLIQVRGSHEYFSVPRSIPDGTRHIMSPRPDALATTTTSSLHATWHCIVVCASQVVKRWRVG